jgi:hypothetical protein
MKNIFKFTFTMIIFILLYTSAESFVEVLFPEHEFIADSSLLFDYGIIIGYILVIVFVVLIQEENFNKFKKIRPTLASIMQKTQILIAFGFIIFVMIDFSFQLSILMVFIFLLISAAIDMIRDKVMDELQGNALHPKKTM